MRNKKRWNALLLAAVLAVSSVPVQAAEEISGEAVVEGVYEEEAEIADDTDEEEVVGGGGFVEGADVDTESFLRQLPEEEIEVPVSEELMDELYAYADEAAEAEPEEEAKDEPPEEFLFDEEDVGFSATHEHAYILSYKEINHPEESTVKKVKSGTGFKEDWDSQFFMNNVEPEDYEEVKAVKELHVVCSCGEWLDTDENGNKPGRAFTSNNIRYHAEALGHYYSSEYIFLGYSYPTYTYEKVVTKSAWTEKIPVYTCSCGTTKSAAPASIKSASCNLPETVYPYTGSAVTPQPTITLNGKTLRKNTDYELGYKNNTAAGTATVTAYGRGDYQGSVSTTFKIDRFDLQNAEMTTYHSVYDYTGKPRKPNVTIKYNGKKLVEGTDYTLTYRNNTGPGEASITATAKGGYIGSKTIYFRIEKNSLNAASVTTYHSVYDYTGKPRKPEVTVKVGTKKLTENKDFIVAYSNNTGPGEATIKVTGIGLYTGSRTIHFRLEKHNMNASDVSITTLHKTYEYTGYPRKPAVTVKIGTKTLKEGVDYVLTIGNNKDISTSEKPAYVEVTGIGNYTGTNRSHPFSIVEKAESIPIYRLYNPRSGEHFYTKNKGERNNCVKNGWDNEGIAWYSPVTSNEPVYRVCNPYNAKHHYTKSLKERDWLVGLGWRNEGIAFYSSSNGTPVYRLYHNGSGNHHYTTKAQERDRIVRTLGWTPEGTCWYVDKPGDPNAKD